MSVIETAVLWAINIANNNEHGYSQSIRWGPSYDCSSLVISAFKQAGLNLQSTYTGNMKSDLLANGFEALSPPTTSYSSLKRGDVLLNEASHTALYIGNGQIVHARSAEGTTDTRDNSGNEIRVQSYYNGPWDVVLRYKEDIQDDEPEYIPSNTVGRGVAALQGVLIYLGYDIGNFGRKKDGIDGDSGSQDSWTNNALKLALGSGKITEEDLSAILSLNT